MQGNLIERECSIDGAQVSEGAVELARQHRPKHALVLSLARDTLTLLLSLGASGADFLLD